MRGSTVNTERSVWGRRHGVTDTGERGWGFSPWVHMKSRGWGGYGSQRKGGGGGGGGGGKRNRQLTIFFSGPQPTEKHTFEQGFERWDPNECAGTQDRSRTAIYRVQHRHRKHGRTFRKTERAGTSPSYRQRSEMYRRAVTTETASFPKPSPHWRMKRLSRQSWERPPRPPFPQTARSSWTASARF